MLIEKSPFVHIFKSNGVVCLYHSLYITNIYGSYLLAELLESLRFPQTIEQAARRGGFQTRPDSRATRYINLLLEHKFLRYIDCKDETNLVSTLNQQAQCSDLRFLYLVPTSVCNLRCKYCHIIDTWAAYGHHHMSAETAEAGIKKFMEHSLASGQKGQNEVMFYGGEPLLAPEVVKHAVSYIRKDSTNNDCKITMFTNGTAVTQDMAEFLADNDVFVIVSMDGPAEVHNQMRCYVDGRGGSPSGGSFEDAARGYDILKNASCRLGISMVLGRHNIPGLKGAVEYLINRFEPIDLGFSTLHLHQHGDNPASVDIELLTKEMIDTFKFVREKGIYAEHLFRRIRPFVEQQIRLKDCPSCGGKFLVTPDKSIGFCEAFLGTGRYYYPLDSFDLSNEGYNEWKGIAPVRREECLRCPAIAICGGGCPYDAWVQHGNINNLDTIRCQQSNILLKWLIWDLFDQITTARVGDSTLNSDRLDKHRQECLCYDVGDSTLDSDRLDKHRQECLCYDIGDSTLSVQEDPWKIIIPEPAQRQMIYSRVDIADKRLPLHGYSKYGER
ncbi:radical SAM protein [Candidatus Desantisbacteria bacterium]|nr:radical SAM protein [Candidatus Desantisbacteria bacterium]